MQEYYSLDKIIIKNLPLDDSTGRSAVVNVKFLCKHQHDLICMTSSQVC